ncbi:unnamed protein product, partial [Protopolystoma xenopodis]
MVNETECDSETDSPIHPQQPSPTLVLADALPAAKHSKTSCHPVPSSAFAKLPTLTRSFSSSLTTSITTSMPRSTSDTLPISYPNFERAALPSHRSYIASTSISLGNGTSCGGSSQPTSVAESCTPLVHGDQHSLANLRKQNTLRTSSYPKIASSRGKKDKLLKEKVYLEEEVGESLNGGNLADPVVFANASRFEVLFSSYSCSEDEAGELDEERHAFGVASHKGPTGQQNLSLKQGGSIELSKQKRTMSL